MYKGSAVMDQVCHVPVVEGVILVVRPHVQQKVLELVNGQVEFGDEIHFFKYPVREHE